MTVCASKQEMDHIARAVNSASGKDEAVGFFSSPNLTGGS